jgi:hypothetical protein|nr:MAG TPA: baseplate protein [Caudoviricetes sp.]
MAKLHLAQQILDIIYPVGSVYLSWNSTDPKNLFGGTWTRLSGGFLYGCVSSVGTGNGTGTATNNHTLTIDQMPSHNHIKYAFGSWGASSYNRTRIGAGVYIGKDQGNPQFEDQPSNTTSSTGGGQGHSHNIPYIAVFAWRRTA